MSGRSFEISGFEAEINQSAQIVPFSTNLIEAAFEYQELIENPPEGMLAKVIKELQNEFNSGKPETDYDRDKEFAELSLEVHIKVAYKAPEPPKTNKPKESKISLSQLPDGVVSMKEFVRKRREGGNYKF